MINIDLSKVETNEWLPGEYQVTCTGAELKDTKNMGKMIKVEFTTSSGRKLWHNFNIVNQSEKAQEIGLGQLKSFLKAAAFPNPDHLTNEADMLNLRATVKVKIEESDGYGPQARISYFKPSGSSTAPTAPTVPGNIF